jgi:hypothetical protein
VGAEFPYVRDVRGTVERKRVDDVVLRLEAAMLHEQGVVLGF